MMASQGTSNTITKGAKAMANLMHLFKVGQKVKVKEEEFTTRLIDGVVKEVYEDHIIVATEDCDHMWYEEGFNLSWVYPEYNF